jgi:hypothetical protein
MTRYISQTNWADAIFELYDNLDDEGKEYLFKKIEGDLYYKEPTREELIEKIDDLDDDIENYKEEKRDLLNEVAYLTNKLDGIN